MAKRGQRLASRVGEAVHYGVVEHRTAHSGSFLRATANPGKDMSMQMLSNSRSLFHKAAAYSSCAPAVAAPSASIVIRDALVLTGLVVLLVGAWLVGHLAVTVPQRDINRHGLTFDHAYPAPVPWAGAVPTPVLIPSGYPPPSFGELPRSEPAIRRQPGPQWRAPRLPGPHWRERQAPGSASSLE